MTAPEPAAPQPETIPVGIRVASTICWVVGALTIVVALIAGLPALGAEGMMLAVAATIAAGVAVCAAAVFIRRRRRVGVLILVAAWAMPMVVALMGRSEARGGNFLLFAALLFAGANWKHLR